MMPTTKCRICGEYAFEIFGSHRCGPSYQVVIIGNNDPPRTPFEMRQQPQVRRKFSLHGIDDAVEQAVGDYHAWASEYAESTTAGAMPWEQWKTWEADHDDDALIDPALLTWYEVTLRMEPAYATHQLSRPSAAGGG